MKLICAGLSKTGTKSIAAALRILGFNVHDIEETWRYYLDDYVDAMHSDKTLDFATMYANVDAVIASPTYLFWKEIFAAFPDEKVLLTVRDSKEKWLESLNQTMLTLSSILSSLWMRLGYQFTPTGRKWKKFYSGSIKKLGSNTIHSDVYTWHNARVMSHIPQDQLLVYNVKQGWKPLCEFLGVEVPDVPFPHLNAKSNYIHDMIYHSHLYKRMSVELILIFTLMVLIFAISLYFLL